MDEYRELFNALCHVKKKFPGVYGRFNQNIDSALKLAESRLTGDIHEPSFDSELITSFDGDNANFNSWIHVHEDIYIYFNTSKSNV